jgi:hypothetical protein
MRKSHRMTTAVWAGFGTAISALLAFTSLPGLAETPDGTDLVTVAPETTLVTGRANSLLPPLGHIAHLPTFMGIPNLFFDPGAPTFSYLTAGISEGFATLQVPTLKSSMTRAAVNTIPRDEFWTNKTSDDLPSGLVVISGFPPPSPSLSNDARTFATTGAIFVVSLAASKSTADMALLVAAAKPVANPANLSWKLFRIQLTKDSNDTHFCTPSSFATVGAPRLGVSPAGRFFVAFDATDIMNPSNTVGSILDFDAQSLLAGGPAKMKCFSAPEYTKLVPPRVLDGGVSAYFLSLKDAHTVARFKLKIAGQVANDTLTATPDITVPAVQSNEAAVQPNGVHLWAGGVDFRTPSVQIGTTLWNVHTVGAANGHSKVRLYKLTATGTSPNMTLTLSTLSYHNDDLLAPSVATDSTAAGAEAFVTFTRTIPSNATTGNATLMLARGPNSSTSGWTSMVLAKSPGQFSKDMFGDPCPSSASDGCAYGPNSATLIDPVHGLVWGIGEIITNGTIGGAGSELNWVVKGFGVPR